MCKTYETAKGDGEEVTVPELRDAVEVEGRDHSALQLRNNLRRGAPRHHEPRVTRYLKMFL